jgi:hypothetical protein
MYILIVNYNLVTMTVTVTKVDKAYCKIKLS